MNERPYMLVSQEQFDALLHKLAEITHPTPSSIEISRNSRGEPSTAVKVYCEVGQEEAAMAKALLLDAQLQKELRP